MEKITFSSTIERKSDIDITNDPNLSGKKVFINWNIQILKTTSKANIVIGIDSVIVYATKLDNDEPISFSIDPENCEVIKNDVSVFDDIFPKIIEIDSENKKVQIGF